MLCLDEESEFTTVGVEVFFVSDLCCKDMLLLLILFSLKEQVRERIDVLMDRNG